MNNSHTDKPIHVEIAERILMNPVGTTFSEFIRKMRKEVKKEVKKEKENDAANREDIEKIEKELEGITTRALAKQVGIDYESFRKIINLRRPTKKRDCIIAICLALQLDSGLTSEALRLYRNMPGLDDENDRDITIIEVLDDKNKAADPIAALNERLLMKGFDPLDIFDPRGKNKGQGFDKTPKEFPYSVLDKRVKTHVEELLFDQYDSLETAYDPNRYNIYGIMWLDDPKNRRTVRLAAGTSGACNIEIHSKKAPMFKSFDSPESAGEFRCYFEDLRSSVRNEQRRMEGILNDTKNYGQRIGANISGDSIHIFVEEYNYSVPERNEYHLMEYANGQYQLSVLNTSAFMYHYLGTDTYRQHFGKTIPSTVVSYTSEVSPESSSSKNAEEPVLLKIRARAFVRLKAAVDECMNELRDHRVFVRNLRYIFDNPVEVCAFYHVEKEFGCGYDEDFGEIYCTNESASFPASDGAQISITFEELCRAFELGYKNIQEICRIIEAKGSVEAILR